MREKLVILMMGLALVGCGKAPPSELHGIWKSEKVYLDLQGDITSGFTWRRVLIEDVVSCQAELLYIPETRRLVFRKIKHEDDADLSSLTTEALKACESSAVGADILKAKVINKDTLELCDAGKTEAKCLYFNRAEPPEFSEEQHEPQAPPATPPTGGGHYPAPSQ